MNREKHARDFLKSVIRLFWQPSFYSLSRGSALKAMQYHGDNDRMILDVQRFLRENDVVRFARDKAINIRRTLK